MHKNLITSVTPENHVSVSLTNREDGETTGGVLAVLTPLEARAFASHLVARAEVAERRVRLQVRLSSEPAPPLRPARGSGAAT